MKKNEEGLTDMTNLTGKTAIITGASSGIGEAIAEYLAMEGVHVVLAARNKEKLNEVVQSINNQNKGRAKAIVTDVTIKQEVEQLVEETKEAYGDIDIYVNNAGLVLPSSIRDGDVTTWENMIDVNIKGVLYGINAVVHQMLQRSTGHIINVSSVSGLEVSKVNTVYSATKFAVRAISQGLEKELARTGVRITNLSPGMVETERTSGSGTPDRTPLEPADIAKAVVYAVSQPKNVNVNEITVRPV